MNFKITERKKNTQCLCILNEAIRLVFRAPAFCQLADVTGYEFDPIRAGRTPVSCFL